MKNFEKIDDYLKGKLSTEKEIEFKNEIAQNEDLAKEVKVQQLEEEAIEFLVEQGLTAQINRVKGEIEEEKKKKQTTDIIQIGNWKKYLLLAASIALVIITFWFINLPQASNKFALLEHKKQFLLEMSENRAVINSSDNFSVNQQKMISEEKRSIKEAIIFFESIPNIDSSYADAQYNLAHAHFLNKDYVTATKIFQNYFDTAKDGNRKKDFAQYNLLLTYLANEDEESAKLIYNDILENNSRYKNNKNLKDFFNK